MPTITVRVRTQIGMWRVNDLERSDTIGTIKRRLEEEHGVVLDHCPLTSEPMKLEGDVPIFSDSMTIGEAKLTNGQILHLRVDESKVGIHKASGVEIKKQITKDGTIVSKSTGRGMDTNGFRPGMMPLRSMKMQWTLDEFMQMDEQFVYRIKAPEKDKDAICTMAHLETSAVNNFQNYMRNFDFRIMRIAYLYGTISEDNSVKIEVIYEPPQETDEISFQILEDPKQLEVDGLVSMLGLQKVGWLYAHPAREKDFYFSGPEIMFTAEQQLEAAAGVNDTPFVTIKMTVDEQNQTVIEAFQVSKQCMDMVAEEVLDVSPNWGSCKVNHTFTVMVEGKAAEEIDNNFFLVTVPIKQFDSEFLVSMFPRANRVDTLLIRDDIANQLKKVGKDGWTLIQLLADFQLLLYLAEFLGFQDDIPRICKCVCDRDVPLDEGYSLLIRSIAGLE